MMSSAPATCCKMLCACLANWAVPKGSLTPQIRVKTWYMVYGHPIMGILTSLVYKTSLVYTHVYVSIQYIYIYTYIYIHIYIYIIWVKQETGLMTISQDCLETSITPGPGSPKGSKKRGVPRGSRGASPDSWPLKASNGQALVPAGIDHWGSCNWWSEVATVAVTN